MLLKACPSVFWVLISHWFLYNLILLFAIARIKLLQIIPFCAYRVIQKKTSVNWKPKKKMPTEETETQNKPSVPRESRRSNWKEPFIQSCLTWVDNTPKGKSAKRQGLLICVNIWVYCSSQGWKVWNPSTTNINVNVINN